ncbi:MAG: hypothetical protein J0I06_16035 [Planctomycetes bacterium]|nr:hypothetical protein [Planctomycetota bacterium]
MKPAACRALRRTLAADQPAFGLWVTLDSPAVTEMAVALGLDWVVIDAEHGHLDWCGAKLLRSCGSRNSTAGSSNVPSTSGPTAS